VTAYEDQITATHATLYSDAFPMIEIRTAPAKGWKVVSIRRHRPNCPDACWRLVLKKI
jgi:hypothetical protein